MIFEWTYPNHPMNTSALERMRKHFLKPTEAMPAPWFISKNGPSFHTTLLQIHPEQIKITNFIEALNDIAGGLSSFPEVSYVHVWRAWFKYLLPYGILRANENGFTHSLLPYMNAAFMNLYPDEITEEYPGFRDDVVFALGTRVFPVVASDESARLGEKTNCTVIFGVIQSIALSKVPPK